MSSSSTRTRTRFVRFVCSILLTFTLLQFGGKMRLHGIPIHFYLDLIEKTLGNHPTESEILSRLEGIHDASERLRRHEEVLRQKQMWNHLDGDPFRDYFFADAGAHEHRVVAEAFNMAHRENMKNYAITAGYSRRTSNELAKEAEASQLTRERLEELNNILSDGVENSRALRKQIAESLETAKAIQEKLLEREKFLGEISAFFGRGPLWIIWEYVQWVFDIVLDFMVEQLLSFENFLLNDGGPFDSASLHSQ